MNARLPKRADAPLRTEAAIPLAPATRHSYALAAAAAAALLIVFLLPSGVGLEPGRAGGAPEQIAAEPQRAALLAASRGRTISLADEIVAVQESPTPTPTAQPTASAAPLRTGAPAATGGSAGAAPGAGTGGTGSGSGTGGSGVGIKPSPTPTPQPTVFPPVPPAGFFRFTIVVYDAANGRPLSDVCLVVGTPSCAPNMPHTDANGRWSADVPITNATTRWDISLIKIGYVTQKTVLLLAPTRTAPYRFFLRRR